MGNTHFFHLLLNNDRPDFYSCWFQGILKSFLIEFSSAVVKRHTEAHARSVFLNMSNVDKQEPQVIQDSHFIRSPKILTANLFLFTGASTIDNQLLPEVFPTDPSGQLMPVFLQPPANAYASKSSPAVLTCVVAHATKAAHFVCHSDTVMESTTDDQVVDEKTQLKARKITLEVTRKEVLDGIGNFNCNCYAASAQGSHSTPDVTVMQACK